MINPNYKNNTYLEEYREAIRSGKIQAGYELIDLLDMLLEEKDSGEYVYNTEQADIRIDFIEHCCFLTKAEYYGKPFKLELWEKAYITATYSFYMDLIVSVDDDGKPIYDLVRRFTESLLLIARKNGKTELMAAIALAELVCGGNAMDICVGSNDDEQSKILFTAIGSMKEQADPKETFLQMTQKVIRTKNKSSLFRLSERMRNLEGRLLPRVYLDEVNMMAREAKMARSAIQSTSVLNDALVFYLTSEGFVVDGYLDDLTKRGRKIIKGESDEKRFLPWMYTQDESPEEMFAALDRADYDPEWWKVYQKSNPNIGKVKKISYVMQELEKAKEDSAHRIWVLNKDFTYKVSGAASWLSSDLYTYEQEPWTLEDFRDCVCIVGVDMAEAVDLNAVTLLFMKRNGAEIDPTMYLHHHFFVPEGKVKTTDDDFDYEGAAKEGHLTILPGDIVDTSVIADYLMELQTNYGIIPMVTGYDLKFAVQFKQQMAAYGYPAEVIIQAAPVLNNSIRYMEQLYRHKRINYNLHPVQRWCLGNASLLVNSQNQALIVKAGGDRRNRIDGPVSTAICLETYLRHRSEFINYIK